MVQERQLPLGYGTARWLEAGAGWPVILLHAFPLSADMWRSQLESVPDRWLFIAPDLRGLGPAHGNPARSMDDLADAVFELLEALHIDSAALGGLSLGGYVAFAMMRRERERFSAIFLADTRAAADTDQARGARNRMLETVRARGADAVADEMLPKLLGESSRRDQPDLETRVRALIRSNTPEGIAGAIEATRDRADSTATLASIDVPTLILCGEEDTLTPPTEARSMQERIRRSNLVLLPRAGHLSNLEAPEQFSTALCDFLAAPL
jgi:pimeloyl-ACP methyl ester carboxylesterase